MSLHRLLLAGAAAAVLLTNASPAQTQAGSRYAAAGMGYYYVDDDFGTRGDSAYTMLNMPVRPGIDLQVSVIDYDYDSDLVIPDYVGTPVGWDQDGYGARIGGLFYKPVGNYKAFSTVSVGAEHVHLRLGPIDDDDVAYLWTLGAGAEWEICAKFSSGFWVSYEDSFNSIELDGFKMHHDGVISGGVFGHLRITRMIGIEGAVSVNDERDLGISLGGTLTF